MSNVAKRFSFLRGMRTLTILALIVAFIATTTYGLMSDASVHGLTTKISYANRYCVSIPGTSAKNVTFYILATVWSTSSLHTSISSASFSLSIGGTNIGTSPVGDSSWDPGSYGSYTLKFVDQAANPQMLPASSTITLSVTAWASAGIASSSVTASDTTIQSFGPTSCEVFSV